MAAGRSIAALNSRAIRSPHRSTGRGAGGDRRLERHAAPRRAARRSRRPPPAPRSPSGVTPPPKAMHGRPAACARFATPSAVLPYAVWASIRPSPVITSCDAARASVEAGLLHHEVDAGPQLELGELARRARASRTRRRRPPRRRACRAPAGRRARSSASANRAQRMSSASDVGGRGALLRPVDRRRARRPEQGVGHVACDPEPRLDEARVEAVEVDRRRGRR